jgi:hypothetical protein
VDAPDARINSNTRRIPPLSLSEGASSIRRYRARFCKATPGS